MASAARCSVQFTWVHVQELGHIPLQGAELQLDGKLMYIRKPGSERIFVVSAHALLLIVGNIMTHCGVQLRAGDEEEAAEWMDAIQQSQLTPQQIASYDAEQRQSKAR